MAVVIASLTFVGSVRPASEPGSSPIYAAQDGLVTDVGSPRNWHGGYGGFVEVKHPLYNNVETFYAHTSLNLVSAGDYVKEGEEIAKVGKTGLVDFGVFGAKHPFAEQLKALFILFLPNS